MMHLAIYADQTLGTGAWRLPEKDNSPAGRKQALINLAQLAEAAKIDGLLLAESLTYGPERIWPYKVTEEFESVTMAAALSMVTERLGFIVTQSAMYQAPFHIARMSLSLDHLTGGRTAWNLVTSFSPSAAENFGRVMLDHDERYVRGREVLEVVRKLWDSFDDDAIIDDRERGIYADPAKIHPANHEGEFFHVKGPLGSPRSPQGQPVLFQAGASAAGRAFAATHADAIFTAMPNFDGGLLFYQQVHEEARRHGRQGPMPLILPSVQVVVGSTDEEARRIDEQLSEVLIPEYLAAWLYEFGVDLIGVDLDGPIPASAFAASTETHQSALEGLRTMAAECTTVWEFLRRTTSGWALRMVGSPETIADEMQRWCDAPAADGFILDGAKGDGQVEAFLEHVVPVLQRRGVFRREYSGTTLRDHLGLPWRPSRYASASSAVTVS